MPRGVSGSTGTPQGNRFWGEGDSRQAPPPCSLQSRPAGMGPRISISGNFANSAEPAALSEQLQQAGTFSLGGSQGGPRRGGQPGKVEVEGHPGQRPCGGGYGRAASRWSSGACGRRGAAQRRGLPGTVRPGEGLPQTLVVRTLRTLVFRALRSPQSLHPPAVPTVRS